MRKIKDIIISKKYFISNKNDCAVFKDVDGKGYTAVWSLISSLFNSYGEFPIHPYDFNVDLKYFWFGKSTFRKIREYHINNRLNEIDYKWLRTNFKVDW